MNIPANRQLICTAINNTIDWTPFNIAINTPANKQHVFTPVSVTANRQSISTPVSIIANRQLVRTPVSIIANRQPGHTLSITANR